jgi:NCAIR mutase (PurE)-related protein
VEDAVLKLKTAPFTDLGFAKLICTVRLRQGVAEVIYGAGKTPEQIIGIVDNAQNGQSTILITRLSPEAAEKIQKAVTDDLDYYADAKLGIIGPMPKPDGIGKIVVATGGTSDIPVAEEAALTAEVLGNEVTSTV